jgi:hypothetical protein
VFRLSTRNHIVHITGRTPLLDYTPAATLAMLDEVPPLFDSLRG